MPELEARLQLRPLEAKLRSYLSALDGALEILSHGQEGLLAGVPAWCLAGRELRLAVNRDGRGILIKVEPREDLSEDVSSFEEIETNAQLAAFIRPWNADFSPSQLSTVPFVMFGPMIAGPVDPLEPPALEERRMIGYGKRSDAEDMFTEESAKRDAIEFWNSAVNKLPQGGSFIAQVSAVFSRFSASIRLKSFRERKVHRILREHGGLLLPSHKRMFFEHCLYLGDDVRKADFILEREVGFPALLVELESPVYRILKKGGELTAEANHAKSQIAEWVAFIDQDAQRNAAGEMNFLAGPKQRLVVMGRGLEDRDVLLKQRFTDTGFWTYELLLEQAKTRWNDIVAEQCRRIGRTELRPF